MRAILAVLTASFLTWVSESIFASPGDLDPTFGNAGKVLLGSHITIANLVLVQPDDRIVVLVSPGTGRASVQGFGA
jgi:hypothetical protein